MTFVLVHHALFLSTGLDFWLWNCYVVCCWLDCCCGLGCNYFLRRMSFCCAGFSYYAHWTPTTPFMIVAARSPSADNSVRGLELVNSAPIMLSAVFIFVAYFFNWRLIIPNMVMASWAVYADNSLLATALTMHF